jgi:nicotinamidase-related amidase
LRSALVVMDVQDWLVERLGAVEALEPIARAITTARAAAIPLIYVGIRFREGSPDLNLRNRTFGNRRDPQREAEIRMHPTVAPRAGDIIVVKKRVSAFAGSDLEIVLRSANVESLALCGISTGGVVLSTLRQAADLDYGLTVLADACADPDPEVHQVLLRKVFPTQAEVTSVDRWATSLSIPEGA